MLDKYATKYATAVVEGSYNVTLHCTEETTNKFYIMQILETPTTYCLYTRYGRIGEVGTINYYEESDLMDKFIKTFKLKTKNEWDNSFGNAGNSSSLSTKFVKYPGKYVLA